MKSNTLLLPLSILVILTCGRIICLPFLVVLLTIKYRYLYKLWNVVSSNKEIAKGKVAIRSLWHIGIIVSSCIVMGVSTNRELTYAVRNGELPVFRFIFIVIFIITIYLFFAYSKYRTKSYQLFKESYTNFVISNNLQDAPTLTENKGGWWSQYCVAYDYFKSKNFFN